MRARFVNEMAVNTFKNYDGTIYTAEELKTQWADYYRDQVEDPDYGEPYIATTDELYNEFGEWMLQTMIYDPDDFVVPTGSECRMYYRAFALAKGISDYKVSPQNLFMDYGFYYGTLKLWVEMGLLSAERFDHLCL